MFLTEIRTTVALRLPLFTISVMFTVHNINGVVHVPTFPPRHTPS